MEDKKITLMGSEFNHRLSITKVRGGWTKNKIIKELKTKRCSSTEISFYKEIAKYENPMDVYNNLFYHGSARHI
jgi:hypothetical protein